MTGEPQGYTPEEIERGDDQPGCTVTTHPVGCILYPGLLALILYGLYQLIF